MSSLCLGSRIEVIWSMVIQLSNRLAVARAVKLMADLPVRRSFELRGYLPSDDCFGAFITYLKQQNLYYNNSIILTADYGDSPGEEGRWRHSYTLFPEIIHISLIIHLRRVCAVKWYGIVITQHFQPTLGPV